MNNDRVYELVERKASKNGFRGKIDAKCIECIYDPISGTGTWKQQVEACTSTSCPLFTVRAKSSGEKDES